jgi:hypothetical protein
MNPKQALERAAYDYLTADATDLDDAFSVYMGIDNPISVNDDGNTQEVTNKVLPCVTLAAEGSHEQVVLFSNVFRGLLTVTVEADSSAVTDQQFSDYCEEVFSKFNILELESSLSAPEDFMCQWASITSIGSTMKDGQNWQAQMEIDVAYSQSDHT